jgi:hypothetical protein
MKKLLLWVLCFCFVVASCERTIDFKLDQTEPKLVVEATIENKKPPFVFLSRSTDYFSSIDPQTLSETFVHGAEVFISNGIKTHKLKEYSQQINTAGYKVYYYSIDSSSLNTAFVGELNNSYSIKIIAEGKEYSSLTTIPLLTKKVDSIWWRKAPAQTDTSKVVIMVKATDSPGFGDYVRYFTKRNREPFFPAFNSVFDDFVIDGTTYELQVDPGFNRNNNVKDDDRMFKRGDTVTLKLCNIDKATYDFWRTMEYSYASIGNPFATPVKVLGNVSNGALGYFGGYASQYHTLVIPR